MSSGSDSGDGDQGPPSNLSPAAVAGQVERVIRNHEDDLSGYDKSWLQNAADYLRYLDAERDRS